MIMMMADTMDAVREARDPADTEPDEIDDSLVFAVLGLALAFEAGMRGGASATHDAETGNTDDRI